MLKKLLFLGLGGDFVGFLYHLVVGQLVAGVVGVPYVPYGAGWVDDVDSSLG
jgi:hypothetical protein